MLAVVRHFGAHIPFYANHRNPFEVADDRHKMVKVIGQKSMSLVGLARNIPKLRHIDVVSDTDRV